MELSVQAIVAQHCRRYLATHQMASHVPLAVWALRSCRTAVLGGHVRKCEQGHVLRYWYNGCGHRACQRCAHAKMQEWLEARESVLLPCDHYHVVFTMPSELRVLWQLNTRWLTGQLFDAVSGTLLTLLRDVRNLGVVPGMTLALHTWSKGLAVHPHIHALVSGGGLDPSGTWKPCRNGFLLPARMMVKVYRGKLLSGLEHGIREARLRLPQGLDAVGALKLLRRAAKAKWNVWVADRYAHGRGVAVYLARYIRGGPIRDSRLTSYDGKDVEFRLRGADRLTLSVEDFVGRLLNHIPAPHTRTVRHYGLYAHTQAHAREAARGQIEPPPLAEEVATCLTVPPAAVVEEICPTCGARVVDEIIPRGGAPPNAEQTVLAMEWVN